MFMAKKLRCEYFYEKKDLSENFIEELDEFFRHSKRGYWSTQRSISPYDFAFRPTSLLKQQKGRKFREYPPQMRPSIRTTSKDPRVKQKLHSETWSRLPTRKRILWDRSLGMRQMNWPSERRQLWHICQRLTFCLMHQVHKLWRTTIIAPWCI